MEDTSQGARPPEAPRGMYTCKLDDRSRLKLPADWVTFFNSLSERTLFITSLDRQVAQIYPMSVWRDNEKLLDTFTEDEAAADVTAFNANDLGGTVEIDSQGRIVIPQKLREQLNMDGQNLHLYSYRGHMVVLTDVEYAKKREQSAPAAQDSLKVLKKAGLK
jgi:MraZ protein